MFCARCGKELRDGQRFCGRCGTPTRQRPVEEAERELGDEASGVVQGDVPEEAPGVDRNGAREEADGVSSGLKTDETVAMPLRSEKSGVDGQEGDQAKRNDSATDQDGGTEKLGGGSAHEAIDAASDLEDDTERLAAGEPSATAPIGNARSGRNGAASRANTAGKAGSDARGAQPRGEMDTAVMPPVAAGNGDSRSKMGYAPPIGPAGPDGQPSSKRNRNRTIAVALAAVAAVVIVVAVLLGTQVVSGEQPTVCTLATLVSPVDAEGNELAGYEVTLVDRETGKEVSSLSVPSGGGFSIGQFRDAQGNQIPNGKYMLRFKDLKSGNVYDGRLVDIDNNASVAESEVTGKAKKWEDPVLLPEPTPSVPPSSATAPSPSPEPSPEPSSGSSGSSGSSSASSAPGSPGAAPTLPVEEVVIPDVEGETCADAERILMDEGLVLVYDSGDLDKRIEKTDPVAGTAVVAGSEVRVERVAGGSNDAGDSGSGGSSGDSGSGGSGSSSGAAASGDNSAGAQSAYRAKVKEYQDKYGKGAIEPVGTGNKQLAGLALVDLVDLDGDGADELLLGYYDKSLERSVGLDGFKDSGAYQLEIWYFNGRDAVRAYKGAMLASNGGWAFTRFFQYDDDWIVLDTSRYETDEDSVQSIKCEVLAFEDGKMSPVLTYTARGVMGTGPESYEVNGEEVDRTEYELTVRHLNEDHDSYTYNMVGYTNGETNYPDGYTVYQPEDVLDITNECVDTLSGSGNQVA